MRVIGIIYAIGGRDRPHEYGQGEERRLGRKEHVADKVLG